MIAIMKLRCNYMDEYVKLDSIGQKRTARARGSGAHRLRIGLEMAAVTPRRPWRWQTPTDAAPIARSRTLGWPCALRRPGVEPYDWCSFLDRDGCEVLEQIAPVEKAKEPEPEKPATPDEEVDPAEVAR
eukprot:SAG22_NODE_4007_length_1427_cov_51.781627_1_plen_129_part_00